MKKIIVLMFCVFMAIAVKAQTYMPNGAVIGTKNAAAITNQTNIKKIITVGGKAWVVNSAGDTLTVGTAIGDVIDASTIYNKLLPDSVQKTANFTLSLTEANRDVYCVTDVCNVITIPANGTVAFPIGTTINFFGEAGILVFKAAANVHLHSDKDSIATSRIHQVVSLKKRGLNYWILYGNLID